MTIAASRPLRFVAVLLGGWIGIRSMLLWPDAGPVPVLVAAIAPPVSATPFRANAVAMAAMPDPMIGTIPVAPRASLRMRSVGAPANRHIRDPALVAVPHARQMWFSPGATPPYIGQPSRTDRPQPALLQAPRLSGSGWMIARPGGTASPFAPQLGGSQAGMRLTYALGDSRRVSLAGRFSSALASRQREAALGIDWKPTALPVHLIAEHRFGIEQARGGPSLGLLGGIGPTRVAGDVRVEAYGQAGGIARGGIEGFADGAVRLTQAVAALGPATLDLGIGAWGGAQRGATRFDVGPAAIVALPASGRLLRLSLEWRQRIAGDARPGSGPALSIGTDF